MRLRAMLYEFGGVLKGRTPGEESDGREKERVVKICQRR